MVLFDLLGQRWTLQILWELTQGGPYTFRELRRRCDDMSPTILNRRLKELRAVKLVEHGKEGYRLTELCRGLTPPLMDLHKWSAQWANALDSAPDGKNAPPR